MIYIIAEAGVNHNGDIRLAERMVDCAADSGADAVKFQTFRADMLASRFASKAPYQKRQAGNSGSQLSMLRRLQLDEQGHRRLIQRCKRRGIAFLSTPFDLESIELLYRLGLKTYKIGSGEVTNLPFLEKIGSLKCRVIISSGMSTLEELSCAVNILTSSGTALKDIVVLHCNTDYPTPFRDVNLSAMRLIRDKLKVKVGYSDHTVGIEVPIAAAALGAEVIEKHFTLDGSMKGPDHRSSLEPAELKAMVSSIRNIELALGQPVKKPTASEIKNIPFTRKSLVAARVISRGEIFSVGNITVKRPGAGISPMDYYNVIGKKAVKNFKQDELIII